MPWEPNVDKKCKLSAKNQCDNTRVDGVCEFVCIIVADDKRLIEDHKQEVDTLQRKVSELQAEYQVELKKAKHLSEVCNSDICNLLSRYQRVYSE